MPGTFSQLLYHVVFSTKRRAKMIKTDLQPRIYEYMGGIVRGEGGVALRIGGMPDHVHPSLRDDRMRILPLIIAASAVLMFALPTGADEAISRAVTVVNRAPGNLVFDEAISRAATVINRAPVDPVFDEAVSRAATVVNRAPFVLVFGEAISRGATVCNIAGLGDLNENGLLDFGDVAIFVDVLLGVDTDLAHIEASDLNCDTVANGLDIQPFVDELLPP